MTDFESAWTLSRKRFLDSFADLNHAQLNWRLHEGTLTVAEMAMHVAGVEVWFAAQLTDRDLASESEFVRCLAACATDGVVNDKPFPFSADEMTPEAVAEGMKAGEAAWGPLVAAASPEVRAKTMVSALGPVIDGNGAFARLSFHAGYHQGQVHLIRTAPGFPKA